MVTLQLLKCEYRSCIDFSYMSICFEMCYREFESQKGDVMGEWRDVGAFVLCHVEVSIGFGWGASQWIE